MAELFFLERLEQNTRGLAPDVRFAHPFRIGAVEGADAVRQSLRAAFEALGQELVSSLEFRGDGAAAVAWRSGPPDREIQGVTLALIDAEGWIRELRIALRPVQFLTGWRERLRARLPAEGGWERPAVPAPSGPAEPADPRLPIPVSDDAVFLGPAFARPVKGGDALRHVVGHARVVYGPCVDGPTLRNGAYVLRAFTSDLPLEIVSIAHLDAGGRVDAWSVFMQPWPSLVVFAERLRERLGDFLDASFYEAPAE